MYVYIVHTLYMCTRVVYSHMQNVGWTFYGSDEWTDSAVSQGKTDNAVLCYHDWWGLLFAIVLCGEVMTSRFVLQIIRPIDACFSFNTQVKELVRLSLNQPVKLFVDSNTDTAYNLRQEFVRIRTKHEGDREAIVAGMSLLDYGPFTLCVTIQLCAFDHSMITVCCFWAPKRTAIACVSFLDYWASRQLNCMATWQCYRYAAVNLTEHCSLFLLPAFGGFKTV